jgi:ATP-dependent exoDNAse (exonuclease V) alpha subunit
MKGLPDGGRQVVVAPTGVAALALKASTIHAFFKLPIGVIDVNSLASEEVKFGPVLRRMTRLVIDEVSMVRADILDGIDIRLRMARDDDRPFGGVQVVLVGDFLQLPPVVLEDDRELLECLGYDTPFAFSSRVMRRTPIRVATLKKVWRQKDPDFIEALGDIREGRSISRAVGWLNERCAREHRGGVSPLLLTATRAAADQYNSGGLSRLKSETPESREVTYIARAGGTFESNQTALPAPRELTLMQGTRVMAVKNDPLGDYVNGSLGVVTGVHDGAGVFEDAFVSVLFDGQDRETKITPSDWSKTHQIWDDQAEAIIETTTGFYQQIPLMFGYAMTIHKSQGLTLEDVRIDLGKGAFAPGQLYVALSRARSVEGLSFAQPIEDRDVRVDEMLVRFLEWARSAENLDFGTSHG